MTLDKWFNKLEDQTLVLWLAPNRQLSKKLLRNQLAKHRYFVTPHTSRFWKHATRPVQFTLMVDDFGIKYSGQEHFDHLIIALEEP